VAQNYLITRYGILGILIFCTALFLKYQL